VELVLTEEQSMLQRAARDFVANRTPLARTRKAGQPGGAGEGFSREIWKEMASLGWLGLTIGAEHGGSGVGHRYLAIVLEEMGRALVPEPLLSTAVLGATAIEVGGTRAQRSEHLPAIVAGERIVALAHQERDARFDLAAVDTSAASSGGAGGAGGGWALNGEKVQVMDGTVADWFVVSAQAPDGVALFLVPAKARGVVVERQERIDGRSCAAVRFEGVTVGADARLGAPERGLALLERVVDAGTIGLCAEMLGSMGAAFAMTLEYLKTREQFGVPIGSFQALQHRAARLYVETELAKSVVMFASGVLDGLDPGVRLARAASAAKVKCADAFMLVATESLQMHGGIGMTDEHKIGRFLKRARVAEMTFGDAGYHRDRFARADGF
jgi:alkylation response protein AidB-like acyl-CoA dehydrogenase